MLQCSLSGSDSGAREKFTLSPVRDEHTITSHEYISQQEEYKPVAHKTDSKKKNYCYEEH